MYVYIYREREKERVKELCLRVERGECFGFLGVNGAYDIYIYIYIYTHMYIYRERESKRKRERRTSVYALSVESASGSWE